jgi:hypothetical protein
MASEASDAAASGVDVHVPAVGDVGDAAGSLRDAAAAVVVWLASPLVATPFFGASTQDCDHKQLVSEPSCAAPLLNV